MLPSGGVPDCALPACTDSSQCRRARSAVRNVGIVCASNTYAVGGNVSGLVGSVTLRLNGASPRTITTNGAFSFAPALAQGFPYVVTVATQPAGQACTVSSGTGTVNGPVSNVQVACSANAYTVGGTITGLTGSVVLQNNGGDSLTSSADGAFTFATPVATGGTYNVTVQTQPSGETCTVTNGSGTIGGANVTNVGVACVSNTATITVSPSVLIVPAWGVGYFTITNTSLTTPAVDPDAFIPSNPSGWSNTRASTCPSVLLPGRSCNVSFYAVGASNVHVASTAIEFKGTNTNTVNVTVGFSLSGQLVYGIKSPGVALLTTAENPPLLWSDAAAFTNAIAQTDGAENTTRILAASGSNDAAQYCRAQNFGGVQWSLPARCELMNCGAPSIKENIIDKGLSSSSGLMWSSTEFSTLFANVVDLTSNVALAYPKQIAYPFRCVAERPY